MRLPRRTDIETTRTVGSTSLMPHDQGGDFDFLALLHGQADVKFVLFAARHDRWGDATRFCLPPLTMAQSNVLGQKMQAIGTALDRFLKSIPHPSGLVWP